MSITIACSHCGARFAGEPEYAGRRIRCPKCQEVFRLPADAVAAEATPDEQQQPAPVAGRSNTSAADFDESSMRDDFEYSLRSEEEAATQCPYCHSTLEPGQVLCMKCGYHLKLKQKLETKHGDDSPAPEETIGFPTELDFGLFRMPLWPIAAAAGAFVLLALVLYLIQPMLAGVLLMLTGLVFVSVGNIWVLLIAFHESFLMGLAVWFVPFFWCYYVVTRIEELWLPLSISVAGVLMLGLGVSAAGGDASESAAFATAWMSSRTS